MGAVTRVVLVDDHPIVLSGIRADLGEAFEVVGEAGIAPDAILVIATTRPDLVVCDLHLPGGGGIAVIEACRGIAPVVVLTVSEAERDVLEAVAAGAVGYLTKTTPTLELRTALLRAAGGEPVFSPSLALLVLDEFRRMAKATTGHNPLTRREREVLMLIARGYANASAAGELHIAEKTVENHVRNIMEKLRVTKRAGLIRYALDHDLR